MENILDKLVDSLNNGNILLAIIIIVAALIFNYKKIVEFLEERKKARILKLNDALSCDLIMGLTRAHLEEELVTEQFKITTGMRLEKEIREAIILAHLKTKGELSFTHFKRALPHIGYSDSKLEITITNYDKVAYLFNLIFGFLLAFFGFIVMGILTQAKGLNLLQIFSMTCMGVICIAIALFMLWQTFPVVSARKVAEQLRRT